MRRSQPYEQLDPDQRALFDVIAGGAREQHLGDQRLVDEDRRLRSPFAAMLLNPAVGHPLQELGTALRFESSLSRRMLELAVLAVAAHRSCEHEWETHHPLARAAGVPEEYLEGLWNDRTPPPLADAREHQAVQLVSRLLTIADPDDAIASVAIDALTDQEIFELASLVGYYSTLAVLLSAFAERS